MPPTQRTGSGVVKAKESDVPVKDAAVVDTLQPAPAPYTHALILAAALLPLAVHIPVNVNIVLLPALTIYAGSWRSVKTSGPPGETMTQKDAMQFPLIGRRAHSFVSRLLIWTCFARWSLL